MHWRVFRSIFALHLPTRCQYPALTTHYSPVVTSNNVSRHCQMCPAGHITPSPLTLSFLLRMTDLKIFKGVKYGEENRKSDEKGLLW